MIPGNCQVKTISVIVYALLNTYIKRKRSLFCLKDFQYCDYCNQTVILCMFKYNETTTPRFLAFVAYFHKRANLCLILKCKIISRLP